MVERDPFPLPLRIDEIDPAWLTAAFRSGLPEVTVRDCEIVDVNHGTSTKVRVRLILDPAAEAAGIPDVVMVKGGFEPHSRSLDHMHRMEASGYRDVYSTIKLPTPQCWYADYDEDRHQGIVVMEDLVRRGVTFCNPLSAATYEEVARRLEVMADFHAATWNSAEWGPEGKWRWMHNGMTVMRQHFAQFLEPDTWNHYVQLPRGAAVSVRFHDRAWMDDAMARLQLLSSRRDHCVNHGDTHPGNLYVDVDGTPGFFDSLPNHTPPMSEVTYHMTCALDPVDRRAWERQLIGHYLERLTRNGVSAPDIEEALADYALWLARAYFVFLINDTVYQTESTNTVYCARINIAMLDHDTIGALERYH